MAGAGLSRTLKLTILGDVDNLNKSLKSATGDVNTFGDKMGKVGKAVGVALAAAAVAAGAMAIKIGVDAVKAASDLSETISKVSVIFGSTSKEIEKFAAGAAKSLGQTKQQALDAAATFATFGKSAGLAGNDLVNFSTDFVSLASDLASFNNTSPEQAITAIGSALRGEAEPLRAYGVLLDDASLRQKALELGLISTTKNALTPQQKVLAAQKLIFEQTTVAQGDFARTSDGLANSTRIMTAQLENAKTTIGMALLPIVLKLAQAFSTYVIPVVEKISKAFSSNGGGLGQQFDQFISNVSKVALPIFNGLVNAFGSIQSAISNNSAAFLAFGKLIADYVAPVIGTTLGAALNIVGKIAGGVINIIGGIIGAITSAVQGAIAAINWLIQKYNSIPLLPNIPTIPVSGAPKVSIPTISTSGKTVSTALPTIPTPTGITTASTSGGSSGVAKAAASASAATVNQPFKFGTSGVNTNTLAGIMAASGTTVNLTVNGAIDPEGTARTIVDTLNNSTYRGTNGASNLVYL